MVTRIPWVFCPSTDIGRTSEEDLTKKETTGVVYDDVNVLGGYLVGDGGGVGVEPKPSNKTPCSDFSP